MKPLSEMDQRDVIFFSIVFLATGDINEQEFNEYFNVNDFN